MTCVRSNGAVPPMKLSRNEKMILWGLVKYPMLNDRQLSELVGVRMSTLNAIKNKMKRMGLITDRIVPNIEVMGYEILSITWAPLNKASMTKKEMDGMTNAFGRWPSIYTSQIFGDTLFFISLNKDYTSYRKVDHGIITALSDKELLDTDQVHSTLYPLTLSKVNKNFDYTTVLERMFDINGKEMGRPNKVPDPEVTREKVYHLTKKEKVIMKGLLQYPDLPDNKIANMLDTTRQAVARHKKELIELNVIKKLRIIDYTKIGFDILCLVEAHYNRLKGSNRSAPDIEHLNLPSFFSVYGNYETVSLSLFQDFQQFSEDRDNYSTAMNKFCRVRGEPMIRLFSPKDTITFKHLDYLPLVDDFLSGS